MTTTNPVNVFVDKVTLFFNTVGKDLEKFADAFLPKVENFFEVALEDIAEIAGSAVLQEAGNVIGGKEKFGNAVAHVIQKVEISGKTVAISIAQQAVQTAYDTAVSVLASKGK